MEKTLLEVGLEKEIIQDIKEIVNRLNQYIVISIPQVQEWKLLKNSVKSVIDNLEKFRKYGKRKRR